MLFKMMMFTKMDRETHSLDRIPIESDEFDMFGHTTYCPVHVNGQRMNQDLCSIKEQNVLLEV